MTTEVQVVTFLVATDTPHNATVPGRREAAIECTAAVNTAERSLHPTPISSDSETGWEVPDLVSEDVQTESDRESNTKAEDGSTRRAELEFRHVLPDILRLLLDQLLSWNFSVKYTRPPSNSPQPNRKAKRRSFRRRPADLRQKKSRDKKHTTKYRTDRHFMMACPYYRWNPAKYHKCLKTSRLRRFGDLVKHLRQKHMKPAYCQNCFRAFETMIDRDLHTRAETCVFGAWRKPDGMSRAQRDKVEEYAKHRASERGRWHHAWSILFPDVKLDKSPYLEYGVERQVCIVHDFWAENGLDLVSRYLASCGLLHQHQPCDDGAIEAFCKTVLNTVLNTIINAKV